jgi:hypothetical protein
MSAVLALVFSLALSPEAAAARQGPMLFGSGQATFLVLGPAGPGETLRLARVRVRHPDLSETRSFDDAEYRLTVDVPASTKPGQNLTGALWRFGAESPEGRKMEDGVRVEIQREDRVAPAPTRGLAYRALGTPDRLYLVHAGTRFAQILRVQTVSELEIPPGGVPVRVDRPSQEAATRILPGEVAKVVIGDGRTTRVSAQAEIWFSSAPH